MRNMQETCFTTCGEEKKNKQTKKLSSTTELGRHVTSHQLQPKRKQITQLRITGALASFAPYDRKSKMVA